MERGSRPSVSARDRETLQRLRNRIGRDGLIEVLKSIPDEPKRTLGAPLQQRVRQSFYAALYLMKECLTNERHQSFSAFARDINRVVTVKYGYITTAGRVKYKANKSREAVEQDTRRGLKANDEKLIANMIQGLIFWRFTCVNSKRGFLAGGTNPNLFIEPIKPNGLIHWIDAAIDRAGNRAELEVHYAEVRAKLRSQLAEISKESDK